jgi:hypothetical protein
MKAFYYTAIVILDCGIGGCAMGSKGIYFVVGSMCIP